MAQRGAREVSFAIMSQYTSDAGSLNDLWQNISTGYNAKGRHYHSINHVEHMLKLADEYKVHIVNYDSFAISIIYHDVVYKAQRKDNELKSAEFMKNDLEQLGVPSSIIHRSYRQIVQTQKHQLSEQSELDDALFLDMDLEVLSWPCREYLSYTRQIRKEYWMYPGVLYKKGRAQAMQSFLDRPSIYFTELFRSKFEVKARENVNKELIMLSSG